MVKEKKGYTIGIDIGGTKMAAVLYDGKRIVADYVLATPKDTFDHFLIMIKALVEPLEEKAQDDKMRIAGIGLGVAGILDEARRKIFKSPNIEIIDNMLVADRIEEMIGRPVIMDNDVNCFLQAEMLKGVGEKYDNAYGIIIGTGIGGAWWLNGDIYRGAHGGGGEPGDMLIDFNPVMALEPAYHKLTQNNPALVAEEAYRGDVLAEKTYEEIGQLLGTAFANIINLIDPGVIIIGGGVIESSALFLPKAKKFMREHISSPEVRKKVKLLKSKLEPHAGAIGAAIMAQKIDS